MPNRFVGFFCGLILAGSCSAQIAFVKKDRLYVLACEASGAPKKGAKPLLICKIHYRYPKRLALSWTADGELELSRDFKRFGAVKPVQGASIRRSAEVDADFPPCHSPDGSAAVIFTSYPENKKTPTGPWFQDAYLVRKKDQTRLLLQRKAEGYAVWSPSGKLLVLPFYGESDEVLSKVIEYPSLKTRYVLRAFPGGDNTFSRNERTIALLASGPLEYRPTNLYDAETGKEAKTNLPAGSWQTSDVTSWSPDGRHYLEECGAQDDSDHWTRHCVAIGDMGSGKSIIIPGTTDAEDPAYSQDGSHFFWILGKAGLLERIAIGDSSKRTVIAKGVTAFAVRR